MTAPRPFRWTSSLVDELHALMSSGASYAAAAARLGVSRNACIGIANRRRAAGDSRFSDRLGTPAPTPRERPVRARPAPRLVVSRGRSERPLFAPRPAFIEFASDVERKSLADVGPRECRFMAGDDSLCCAAPTDGDRPYCPYHARLAYRRRA